MDSFLQAQDTRKLRALGDITIIAIGRDSTETDGGAGGGESISRGKKSHVFRDLAAGKRDQAATRSTIDLRLVDFLPIKTTGIVPFISSEANHEGLRSVGIRQ
jgi:hypothetical protein